ncbi:hypothetical protein [Nocardia canadensis]|uniref:hypothetical protein n=1 Tax=Nocardia canadensis TaxID=3065238 RepID=UPI00292D8798|nr:hypothetical protein [Nocardia canadensis]
MHWLLYRRLGVATGLGRTARRALAVGLVLLWIPPVVAVGAGNAYSPQPIRPIVWWGEVWLAVIFYLLIGLAVLGVVFAVARLLEFRHRRGLIQVASGVLVVASLGTVAYGVTEANDLRVLETDLSFAELPRAADGPRYRSARGAAREEREVRRRG